MKRTTVRLPLSLLQEAQAAAAGRRTTLTELIESGLRLELKVLKQPPAPVPDLPVCRVSRQAEGAFAPDLPPEAASWSLGAWEEWMDSHPGTDS